MKIAIFIPNLKGGGAERVFVNLTHYFIKKGYEVNFVLIEKQGELLDLLPSSVKIFDLKASHIFKSFLPLKQYLKDEKPDALIAVMWPLTVLATISAILANFKGVLVLSDHNTLSLSTKNLSNFKRRILKISIKFIYPLADVRLAVSDGMADDISNFTALNRSRFKVIHNPIFLQSSNVGNLKIKKRSKYRIVNLGALSEQKNQALLIKAFSLISDKIDVELVILGEGPLRYELEKLVSDLNLKEKIQMPGFITDPSQWYEESDLFVLSSIYEGLPMVLLEALTFGLPIVSTDCKSGPREILCNGKYGKLVPVGDADALAKSMLQALQEEPDIEFLKRRAADFSVDKIAEQYLDVMFPGRLKKNV